MLDIKDDSRLAYSVQKRNDSFEVCASSGRIIMVCGDEGSANHYMSLLNEAHKAGYKLGYKDGRKF